MNKDNFSRRAYLLHLNAMSLANGMRSGTFKSLYRGHGVEFNGVREYLRGDDVRAIDWNVTARMGKPFVKIFEEERELDVFIVIDRSLSMVTGSGKKNRLDLAFECAELLTFASYLNGSPVGCVIFDGQINFSCEPKSGKNHALLVLAELDKKRESVEGSAIDNALRGASKLLRKRSLVFVISDFRAEGWESSFGILCQKNDVIALRITDTLDEKLPELGSVVFKDPETDYECVLPTSGGKFERKWSENFQQMTFKWRKNCIRHGGFPYEINTSQDATCELIKLFCNREIFSLG